MSLMCLLLKPLCLQVLGVTGQMKKNKPKDVRAPPTRQKMMTKSVKASTTWNPPLRSKEEESQRWRRRGCCNTSGRGRTIHRSFHHGQPQLKEGQLTNLNEHFSLPILFFSFFIFFFLYYYLLMFGLKLLFCGSYGLTVRAQFGLSLRGSQIELKCCIIIDFLFSMCARR